MTCGCSGTASGLAFRTGIFFGAPVLVESTQNPKGTLPIEGSPSLKDPDGGFARMFSAYLKLARQTQLSKMVCCLPTKESAGAGKSLKQCL